VNGEWSIVNVVSRESSVGDGLYSRFTSHGSRSWYFDESV